ncbi:proteasome accessory factor PafA2 [Egibacter rhizosphaerae]|uniref:Proteasome accessory factor PafA2 n=1 Tax=Egibacter rhizosphaerae TaxID=1670831 RepID=A0A411YKK8_9ACTN|nr:depupylase/deamidase Dop [Egibacter rhizosphaerae]QBI21725.1 proteasome accessory factor PafA2 [Egibacter rhizosphaerae]
MASPKYLGTETEFGISVVGRPDFNPVLASSLVVNAYSADGRHRARWDYEEENPLRDARGFTQPGGHEPAPEDDVGLANTILTNGARFYVDHAHPEYSTPECATPYDATVWDKAGERILEHAAERAAETLPHVEGSDGARPGRIVISKNNTDGKGAAYGMHENYIMDRRIPFGELTRHLIPFFVSRQVLVGAGRIGNEFGRKDVPYQISQRADFFEVEVGLETTLKRPIVNTRDEPHADPERFRRLHVIIGDANLSEVCTYLKLGATSLVLSMVEDGFLPPPPVLAQPVKALHAISHDISCSQTVALDANTRTTAVELQWQYLERARKYHEEGLAPEWAEEVLALWERLLSTVEDDPMKLDGVVDWVTKHQLLDRYAARDGLDWSADKLKLIDVQYHDVRQDKGLYNRLVDAGRIERVVDEGEVQQAVAHPPRDTRAYFRGRCLEKYRDAVAAAGWDALIFDVGRESLQRVPMMDPGRGGAATTEALIDRCDTAEQLLDALQGN